MSETKTETNLYAKAVQKELRAWERSMLKRPGIAAGALGGLQTKAQELVPQRVQELITASVKKMTVMIMSGSNLLTGNILFDPPVLSESDYLTEQAFKSYDKAAMAQGFGFGLGGVLLGLADFPALLSIKVKFLYDCARFYGFDAQKESERVFMLYVFQLAFCGDSRRLELFPLLRRWDESGPHTVDWSAFQTEYRNYIDLYKLLQLLPLVGSVAGASANHGLLKKLKVTAMNCYRLRALSRESGAAGMPRG